MTNVKKQDIRDRGNEPSPQELPQQELDQVAGGRKAGESQKEFLVVKLQDCLITGY